jgi:hypothetical protein
MEPPRVRGGFTEQAETEARDAFHQAQDDADERFPKPRSGCPSLVVGHPRPVAEAIPRLEVVGCCERVLAAHLGEWIGRADHRERTAERSLVTGISGWYTPADSDSSASRTAVANRRSLCGYGMTRTIHPPSGAVLTTADCQAAYPEAVVRKHDRFALNDVVYAGIPIGSATVDVWEASDGSRVWCARVFVDLATLPTEGPFAGFTRERGSMSGRCHVGKGVLGPMSRTKQIVELLGEGELIA